MTVLCLALAAVAGMSLPIWTPSAAQAKPAVQAKEPMDINRATLTELMQVPGMTTSWAGRIVRFRPYRTKLDLLQRGVVTAEVYRRIRDGIVAHRMEK